LSWGGATDNVGVTGYNIYQGEVLLNPATSVTDAIYNVTGLTAGTEYTYTVQAVDAAGNESTNGPSATTITNTSGGSGSVTVTLSLSTTTASVGETVTASGTTAPNAWVPIKVVDASQSIIVLDTAEADAGGNYSIDFKVPESATGTLTVVVGEGSNVATKSLTIPQKIDECFIATAAYGSKFEPSVVLLRHFRDKFLLTNSLGTAFVNFYYRNSPPIAKFIAGSKPLKFGIRALATRRKLKWIMN